VSAAYCFHTLLQFAEGKITFKGDGYRKEWVDHAQRVEVRRVQEYIN
jgi:hypothetical protein